MTTGGLRAERLARLGRLLNAQAAPDDRAGHQARHRIDRLLDRDSPFLELSPLAPGPVTGIGLVAGTGCVVVAGPPGDPPAPKAARARDLATACRLPLLILEPVPETEPLHLTASPDDADADPPATPGPDAAGARLQAETAETARLRQAVRHGAHPTTAVPDPPEPPVPPDPDAILDAAAVNDILDHVLDGSRFDAWTGPVPDGLTLGWGAVGGLPVAVVGRDGPEPTDPPVPFLEQVRAEALPLVRLVLAGPSATVAVAGATGEAALAFSWPGGTAEYTGDDGAIDPRDTRVVLAIARWCVEAR